MLQLTFYRPSALTANRLINKNEALKELLKHCHFFVVHIESISVTVSNQTWL